MIAAKGFLLYLFCGEQRRKWEPPPCYPALPVGANEREAMGGDKGPHGSSGWPVGQTAQWRRRYGA